MLYLQIYINKILKIKIEVSTKNGKLLYKQNERHPGLFRKSQITVIQKKEPSGERKKQR